LMILDLSFSVNKLSLKRNQTGWLMVMLKMILKYRVNSVMQETQLSWTMDLVLHLVTGLITLGLPINTRDPLMILFKLAQNSNKRLEKNQTGSLMEMIKMISRYRVNSVTQVIQLSWTMDSASHLVTGQITLGQLTNIRDH